MTYATLMVHLALGHSNASVLRIAGDVAERFKARVIGISVCQPMQIGYAVGSVSGEIFEQDREEIHREFMQAEAEFRSALQTRVGTLEWRSTVTFASLSDYLSREARSTDLFIAGGADADSFDASRAVNTGDLIMQLGRPVLIVPAKATELKLERVVIGWKDTRETRRAVSDALPLLKKAAHIVVVEIAAGAELAVTRTRLNDVVGWLKEHGVIAEPLAAPFTGDDLAQLYAIAGEQEADLIVAGAYGHSRMREWVLGGVTRDLLLNSDRCSLLSH